MADAQSSPADASTIAMGVAARLIKVSPRRLQQLVADGWIPRAGHGRYTVVGVVHGYIAYRDDQEQCRSAAASDTDLRAVRRREIERRMAIREMAVRVAAAIRGARRLRTFSASQSIAPARIGALFGDTMEHLWQFIILVE